MDVIHHELAERAAEANTYGRRASISDEDGERFRRRERGERETYSDDDDRPPVRFNRPRENAARVHRPIRLASLGHEIAPRPAPAPSLARETHQQPEDPNLPHSTVASLGPEAANPAPSGEATRKGAPGGARNKLGTMVASLGREFAVPLPSEQPSLSGGHINWVASAGCLASPLRGVLAQVAANFGQVRVNSTCRSRRHNARVGGAKHSYHLTGSAADFRVFGKFGKVLAFLRKNRVVGGLKHYGGGLFHIDIGPRRTW